MVDASAITALLGPTNTGKTHRAMERMLEHRSGMIGLPLRLLAREVYDKLTLRVGEAAVALVTGEETRVPPRPAYWVSTVEAMPVEREVDFVAVDEVQLAAGAQRGHVFTSRILAARGRKETWFMGAETMRSVLDELVPTARALSHPRLSSLAFAGEAALARVAPRSAIVAFSTAHVYELAERLRARKGGAAVVLGALSPRTRNAQVAMFQAGEVDYLVATDAVGMGLNLDCRHVAFASVRKFDGQGARPLADAELAQVAGRAGRWIQSGTFGTIEPVRLTAESVRAIEGHRFERVRRVHWRSDALDFASLSSLAASLDTAPTRRILRPVPDAEDRRALAQLMTRPEVVRRARGEPLVRLLWEVATIPDFRKILFEAHVEQLAALFVELADCGRLSDDWIATQARGIDDASGDIDALVARIAAIRMWSYVANRASWLESPAEWCEATRSLEDRLSDALHARLVLRFVDAKSGRTAARPRRPRPAPKADEGGPLATDAGHPFAKLALLRGRLIGRWPEPEDLAGGSSSFVDDVVGAPHEAFGLTPDGRILLIATKRELGALVRGKSVTLPDVRLTDFELGAGARSRLLRRLVAYSRDVVSRLLEGLPSPRAEGSQPAVRGLLHYVTEGLGTVATENVAELVARLTGEDHAALARAGLVLGGVVTYLAAGLRPAALRDRAALATAYFGGRHHVTIPRSGAVSVAVSRHAEPAGYAALGYPLFARRAVRADIAERTSARLRSGASPWTHGDVASWVGCSVREAPELIAALVGRRPSAGGEAPP